MKNRIAILVRRFPKLSETFILGEIAALVGSGLDVRILSLHRPYDEPEQPDAAQFANRVSYLDTPCGPLAIVRFCLRLLRRPATAYSIFPLLLRQEVEWSGLASVVTACEEFEIGHIHAHYISEPALLADLASGLMDTTFSVSAHAKDIYQTKRASIAARIDRAAFVSTCTAFNRDYLARIAGHNRDRILLSYHGIDADHFRPGCPSESQSTPLIVAVGRYKEKKGFDLLVRACADLVQKGIHLRCDIIGYGDQQPVLQDLIDQCGVASHVHLKPPVDHGQLVEILHDATLCVLPCRRSSDGDCDGIPNSLLEAMSCSVPVVSTTVSGIPEVVQSGVNGLLVEPDDAAALASAINRLLADNKLRTSLAKCGRSTIREMFHWETNVAVLSGLLSSLAARTSYEQSSI